MIHDTQSNALPMKKIHSCRVRDKAALDIHDELDQQEFGHKGAIPQKLLQAKIKALSVQLQETLKLKEEAERQNIELGERLRICIDEKKKLELSLLKKNNTLNSQKGNENNNLDYLRFQNETLRNRVAKDKTIIEAAERGSIDREAKLSALIKEIDKYEVNIQSKAKNMTQKNLEIDPEKNTQQVYERLKLAENQNFEIVYAFKKQLKLIDILRRQKVHIEALKFIQIREQEINFET